MLIICPACRKRSEIEHAEHGCHVECVCGHHFDLDEKTILCEFTQVDDPPPLRIGPYPIEGLIGCGGMGKVFKGTHPQLGLPVAVKVLRQEYARNDSQRERFIKSARICAKLSHPNIVRVYDFGFDENGAPYLVLEYIGGGTFQNALHERGKLSAVRTAEVGASAACALGEANKLGIVHRDIKPDNIMLDNEGVCKLSDLGLAKIDLHEKGIRAQQNYSGSETAYFTGLGTPEYAAPEQTLDAQNCDIRADIYALGVTMYQLVTGKLPYDSHDASKLQVMRLIPPLPPSAVVADIPAELDMVIMRCLEADPEKRYQTPEALRADLEAFLFHLPLPSQTDAAEDAEPVPCDRVQRINILLFLLLLVTLICMIFWIIYFNRDRSGSIPPVEPDPIELHE